MRQREREREKVGERRKGHARCANWAILWLEKEIDTPPLESTATAGFRRRHIEGRVVGSVGLETDE